MSLLGGRDVSGGFGVGTIPVSTVRGDEVIEAGGFLAVTVKDRLPRFPKEAVDSGIVRRGLSRLRVLDG